MFDKHVPFLERTRIKQKFYSLARCKFSFAVLCVDALFPSALTGKFSLLFEASDDIVH